MTDAQILYQRARAKWGDAAQLAMCAEECAELIVALNHLARGRLRAPQLAAEIADVQIMLEQVAAILNVEDSVQWWRKSKLERLRSRLGEP